MTKTDTKKVCILVLSLSGGGAERSAANLSVILDDLGYDVHVVTVLDEIEYVYKGQLLNLGKLKTQRNSVFERFHRYRVFRHYIKEQNFDYIIDNRTRIGIFKEFILSRFTFKPHQTIYCVRSAKLINYMPSSQFLARLLYKDAYRLVAVSHGIAKKLSTAYGFKNVSVIHNPVIQDKVVEDAESPKTKIDYILFYGRLDDAVKNISLLLSAYAASRLPVHNVRLKLMGDGPDLERLKKKCRELNVETHVDFLKFKSNPYTVVKSAFLTLLTSRYEGFPRVLLESLACGTPVVSVDCDSGPREIIRHELNGLLVKNHNTKALSDALNRMVEDEELYLTCRKNARKSVEQFSMEKIGLKWKALLV